MSSGVGSIAGRVLNAAGAPAVGVSVMFLNSPGPHSDISAITDANGRFRFGRLKPGAYRIGAFGGGTAPAEADVAVAAGAEANVELQFND